MALREVFHVVATQLDVEPNHFSAQENDPIIEGQAVTQNDNGYVKRANALSNIVGIAGDSLSNTAGFTELAADIVVSPSGATRSTENRVSDFFDESLASSKLTVYISGGQFLTDQYVTTDNWDVLTFGGNVYVDINGLFTVTQTGSTPRFGTMVQRPEALQSGVPGVGVRGSISSGNFVGLIMNIG